MNGRQDKGKEKERGEKRAREEEDTLSCNEELDYEADIEWEDPAELEARDRLMSGASAFIDDEAVEESDGGEGPAPVEAQEAAQPPKKKFRLNARQLFLTYPQCVLEPDEVLTLLTAKLGEPEAYIIAQEAHQVKRSCICHATIQ